MTPLLVTGIALLYLFFGIANILNALSGLRCLRRNVLSVLFNGLAGMGTLWAFWLVSELACVAFLFQMFPKSGFWPIMISAIENSSVAKLIGPRDAFMLFLGLGASIAAICSAWWLFLITETRRFAAK
jgi:hypothetical protein